MSRRQRKGQIEEEDASFLKLGEEFNSAPCVLISEVRVLLEGAKQKKLENFGTESAAVSDIMQKTLDYCSRFSKFTSKQTVKEIRGLIPIPPYHEFEAAQLANLCCETVEEAKALIPTLSQHDDDEVQRILEEMHNLKKFQIAD
ncbi:HRDC-like protein [Polychytrium aggregatum]|uniref:HRDC-like protein n=1 Tax=Polychytrium aggregatum TaxID=110093 RepID=UPI0022FE45A8|nr:HRDC-like protein [Polychytrium aggregatum]KAI9203880.1 HRDC-like protein [Polychytrium aggregatum]